MKKRVFISSTHTDLQEYRNKVKEALSNHNFEPVLMEDSAIAANPHPPIQTCYDEIRRSDIFLGIYGPRYGSYPEQETKSYIELEYDFALGQKNTKGNPIQVYSFIADQKDATLWEEATKIKESLGENGDAELQAFISRVSNNRTAKKFDGPKDLALKVTYALANREDKQLSVSEWYDQVKNVEANRKVEVIQNLLNFQKVKALSNSTSLEAIDLVANDFRHAKRAEANQELADALGPYLIERDGWPAFKRKISRIDGDWRLYLKGKLLQNTKLVLVLLAFGLGMLLTMIAYQSNFGGFRSTYLPLTKAPKIHVVNWLMEHVEEGSFLWSTIPSDQRQEALFALELAHELSPGDRRIIRHLDRDLNRVKRMLDDQEPSLQILEVNWELINQYCQITSYDEVCLYADSLQQQVLNLKTRDEALNLFASLEASFEVDSSYADWELLQGYQKFRADSLSMEHVDTSLIDRKIAVLEEQIHLYDQLEVSLEADTLTLSDKEQLCLDFVERSVRPSPTKKLARSAADSLSIIVNRVANFKGGNLELYGYVGDSGSPTREPQSSFNLSGQGVKVYVWGRVFAKKSDYVTVKWYQNGGHFHTNNFSVGPSPNGSRRYYYKTFTEKGRHEVRFYNKDNYLIGRKTFYVN